MSGMNKTGKYLYDNRSWLILYAGFLLYVIYMVTVVFVQLDKVSNYLNIIVSWESYGRYFF